jgi:protein-tyrosine phosphatase
MVELDQIYKVHDNLYIGAYWPRLNFEKFKEIGITAIVNSYIEEILSFIDQHVKDGKVLVHCAMGISRSGGIIVAWILKENPTWSWDDAMDYINKSRLVFPAVEIRESVLDYFESLEGKRREF